MKFVGLWESQGLVVSRLKRVRFGPVFLNSDLPMGRWREMSQHEVDILSAEVGLTPVAMPQMNAKTKDKLERMQRKSSRPLGKSERVRQLRPAKDAVSPDRPAREPRLADGERPARKPAESGRPASALRARPLVAVATLPVVAIRVATAPVAKTVAARRSRNVRATCNKRPAKPRLSVPASIWSTDKPVRQTSRSRRPAPASVQALVVASQSNLVIGFSA